MIFAALFALATVIHLGPETPVGTHVSGAAASEQYSPAIAWNGHIGLAVWIDQRATYPADVASPRNPQPQMLRISQMRADGSLVNPEGTPLLHAYQARIASNGSSFMLAYVDEHGINTVPLNENGEADGVQMRVASGSPRFDLISNQHTFVVAITTDAGTQAIVLQPSGIATAVKTFGGTSSQFAPAAAAFGDVYAFAYTSVTCLTCKTMIHLALMAEDAATTDAAVAEGSGQLGLTASDDRLLLGMIDVHGILTLTADRNLRVLAPLTLVAPLPNQYVFPPMLWDGQNFVLTFVGQHGAFPDWEAVRISPNDVALDATPAVIASNAPGFDVAMARTSDGIVAMWYDTNDLYRRTFRSVADLFAQPVTQTPAVLSPHAQSQAAASSGVRVWREGSLDTRIMLSAGDQTIEVVSGSSGSVRNPSLAIGGSVIMVLWREVPPFFGQLSSTGYRVYARRFTRDGTPLDPEPLLVERNDSDYVDLDLGTAVAFDGRNFVAIWSGAVFSNSVPVPSVHARRIAPDGAFVDSASFSIAGVSDFGYTTSLRAISTGSEVLVAWSTWNDYRYVHGISPSLPPNTAIEIVRLDTQGTSMNVVDKREAWNDADLAKQIDLAWNGTNALLASVHRGCVTLTLLDATLATKSENASVECGSRYWYQTIEHPSVAWNGTEFVAAWAADAVHAMRFDRTLQPLDDAPFSVAPAGVLSHEPSLAASPSGVEITYERLDSEVPRLFTRQLDRLGVVPRTRSIR